MNKNIKRIIYLIILIVPVTTVYMIGQVSISKYKDSLKEYKVKLQDYEATLKEHAQKVKEKELQAHMESKRENGKQWVDSMMLVFSEKYKASQIDVKKELQKTIDIAYTQAHKVTQKYKNKKKYYTAINKAIKLELSKIKSENGVFLVDFAGNTLFGSNSAEDINARTILLEEVQKVRRRGGGYILSDIDYKGTKRHIIVKDLGINKLFIGADLYVNKNNIQLKENLLDIAKNALLEESDCVSISQNNVDIYSSLGCKNFTGEENKYDAYFKAIDWTLSYCFNTLKKEERETQKLENFESLLKVD